MKRAPRSVSLNWRAALLSRYHGGHASAPWRPNPIGISVVRLKRVRSRFLDVSHVDMVDGTPLLDIKPYIPELGKRERVKLGWLERVLPIR